MTGRPFRFGVALQAAGTYALDAMAPVIELGASCTTDPGLGMASLAAEKRVQEVGEGAV
jgi:hypothetical protein